MAAVSNVSEASTRPATHHKNTMLRRHDVGANSFFRLNPLPAKSSYLIFHPLEVVRRGSDAQLQVGENYSYV